MSYDCPFCAILAGQAPGRIIARDDNKEIALIQSLHPEAAIHWLAIPYEHIPSLEALENWAPETLLDLLAFATAQAQSNLEEYPELQRGFTLKLHYGAYETVPHAKLHLLSTE